MNDNGIKAVGGRPISGLSAEHFLDAATGASDSYFLLNGVMVEKVRVTGKLAEQMAGLAMIENDLISAKKWVQKAYDLTAASRASKPDGAAFVHVTDKDLFNEVKAFFVAGLTFYGKAFTEAHGRKVQLQRDWLKLEFRKIHDHFIHFRHNFAAHSGDEKIESAGVSLLLIPVDDQSVLLQPAATRSQPGFAEATIQESDFLKLLDHVISIVMERHYAAGKRLMTAVNQKPLAFWCVAAQGKVIVNLDDATKATHKQR